ncbi:nucleoside deaminase [Pseudoalteromonas xiamenensis]
MNYENYVDLAIESAIKSAVNGNLPYGCILLSPEGQVIETGKNSILTKPDLIGHAEINLIQALKNKYSSDYLKQCTIVTSDEPCSMCSSAIYWAGFKRLIYGLSKQRFYREFGRDNPDWDFEISAKDILSKGGRDTEVIGPFLEDKVLEMHKAYKAGKLK